MKTIKVAWFLATRQLFRNNKKTVALIVAIMTLTFLNLVAVSGILVGLIEGSSVEYRNRITGDVIVKALTDKDNIPDTNQIESFLSASGIVSYTTRYAQNGRIEANYTNRKEGKDKDVVGTLVVGIQPSNENKVTKIDELIIEGEPLTDSDRGKILIGKELLSQYANVSDADRVLNEVQIGDRVLVTMKDRTSEFIVKGFIQSKAEVLSQQVFINETDLRTIAGYVDLRAQNISIRKLNKNQSDQSIKQLLTDNGFGKNQEIQTYDEAEPAFVGQIKTTFAVLGNFFGAIGLIVGFITIFIVIYVNAITRRKYIGIMKGIGMSPAVIETSYIIQSIFYGVMGSILGAILVYFVFIPLLNAYPIDFPFSDGIMVAPYDSTLTKFAILMFATVLAGYLPARSIVKGNTLNAILGR